MDSATVREVTEALGAIEVSDELWTLGDNSFPDTFATLLLLPEDRECAEVTEDLIRLGFEIDRGGPEPEDWCYAAYDGEGREAIVTPLLANDRFERDCDGCLVVRLIPDV